MSEVECAGSVETSSTRFPSRVAASAMADAHVVLPTPPFPPKKRTRLRRSSRMSAAGHAADRRAVHAHAPVPGVELFEEVRIDVEQVDRRGIREPDQLHEALQHEQIVEVDELLAQLPLVLGHEVSVQEIADVVLQFIPPHSSL